MLKYLFDNLEYCIVFFIMKNVLLEILINFLLVLLFILEILFFGI